MKSELGKSSGSDGSSNCSDVMLLWCLVGWLAGWLPFHLCQRRTLMFVPPTRPAAACVAHIRPGPQFNTEFGESPYSLKFTYTYLCIQASQTGEVREVEARSWEDSPRPVWHAHGPSSSSCGACGVRLPHSSKLSLLIGRYRLRKHPGAPQRLRSILDRNLPLCPHNQPQKQYDGQNSSRSRHPSELLVSPFPQSLPPSNRMTAYKIIPWVRKKRVSFTKLLFYFSATRF